MQIQKSETPLPSRPATTGNKAKPPATDPFSFAQREISPLPSLQSRVEISPKGKGTDALDFLNMADLDFEPSAPTLGEFLKLNFVAQTENTDHFYINGIRTPRASAQADADFLTGLLRKEYTQDLKQAGFPEAHPLSSDASIRQAETAQVDFELLYNPSAVEGGRELLGSLLDVEEALRNLGGFETDIAAATADRFYATLSQGRHLFVAAHSQGGPLPLMPCARLRPACSSSIPAPRSNKFSSRRSQSRPWAALRQMSPFPQASILSLSKIAMTMYPSSVRRSTKPGTRKNQPRL